MTHVLSGCRSSCDIIYPAGDDNDRVTADSYFVHFDSVLGNETLHVTLLVLVRNMIVHYVSENGN